MAVDATVLIGGALGGAVAQSVLGPLVGQRHERRNLRANALQLIAEIENVRWASNGSKKKFIRLTRELKSAALVAGLRRGPIELYLLVAAAAREQSEHSLEFEDEPELAGAVPSRLAALAQNAAAMVTDYAWHPYAQRLLLSSRMKRLTEEKADVTADLSDSAHFIRWDEGLTRIVGR